jgi:hypothetical protein
MHLDHLKFPPKAERNLDRAGEMVLAISMSPSPAGRTKAETLNAVVFQTSAHRERIPAAHLSAALPSAAAARRANPRSCNAR